MEKCFMCRGRVLWSFGVIGYTIILTAFFQSIPGHPGMPPPPMGLAAYERISIVIASVILFGLGFLLLIPKLLGVFKKGEFGGVATLAMSMALVGMASAPADHWSSRVGDVALISAALLISCEGLAAAIKYRGFHPISWGWLLSLQLLAPVTMFVVVGTMIMRGGNHHEPWIAALLFFPLMYGWGWMLDRSAGTTTAPGAAH